MAADGHVIPYNAADGHVIHHRTWIKIEIWNFNQELKEYMNLWPCACACMHWSKLMNSREITKEVCFDMDLIKIMDQTYEHDKEIKIKNML